MHLHSTTGASRYEDVILGRLGLVRKLAWKYSGGSTDLFEELYSIGVTAMCEAAEQVPVDHPEPGAYLYKAAQHDMLDELQRLRRLSTVSLDAPLSSDDSLTLADVLPDDHTSLVSSPRSHALNGALRRLPSARQRAVLRRRFALPGYGAHSLEETARVLGLTVSKVDHARHDGIEKLRSDARLCKVVGVHHGC